MDEFVAVFRVAPRIPRLFMAALLVVGVASAWWWIKPTFNKQRPVSKFGWISLVFLAAFVAVFAYFQAQIPVIE